jgi:hypothetical protein
MSLALIQESAKEVRRLAIAGSPLAVGDFRLKKLIPPLEQAGAKVPVFGQVAKAIGELVNGTEADSAARLLGLSTLLNAILYTQGVTGAEGDYRALEVFASGSPGTRTTARVLKPLIEAMTSTGSGRFEVVKSAVERGALSDLRLIEPAIRALDDIYPELADLIAEQVLPTYGPGIVPLLKQKLDLKGKKGDARRLRVVHRLDPATGIDLSKAALEDGSPEVKVSAIACLGEHEECLALVLEQTNAKNKLLRAAALEALAGHDRPEVTSLFTELLKGKTLDVLVQPFRAMRSRQVFNSLLEEGKRVFALLLKDEAESSARLLEILACLQERTDAEAEEFLLACFGQCEKIVKLKAAKGSDVSGADLVERLATLLYGLGSPRALEALLAKRAILPVTAFSQVFQSALRTWPPAKVYQEFAPLLQQQKGAGKQKVDAIERIVWTEFRGGPLAHYALEEIEEPGAQAAKKTEWDPRWLDAALKADLLVIVSCLARPGHKGVVAYLLKVLESKGRTESGLLIRTLARCQYPNLTDLFLEQVVKRTKNARYFDYDLQLLFESARYLPPTDLPRLEALAAKLDEKFVDQFLVALEPLRAAKQAATTQEKAL